MAQKRKIPQTKESNEAGPKKEDANDILPLIRLLLKKPSPDHDFKTCPICKENGITQL